MLIVNRYSIDEISSAIMAALQGARDHHQRQAVIGTIDPDILRRIALGAMTAATGETVWIDGEVIERGPEEALPFVRTVYDRKPR